MRPEEILLHFGIKGMKWGVVNKKQSGSSKSAKDPNKSTIKEKVDSVKREHSWRKAVKNMNNMTTKEINNTSRRINLENDFQRLTKNRKISSPADKRAYIKRADLSDGDITRRVTRLRAKESLQRAATAATKEQIDLGKRIVTAGGSVGVKYALTGTVGKNDLFRAATSNAKQNQQDIRNTINKEYQNRNK